MGTLANVRGLGAVLVALTLGVALGRAERGGPGLTYANYDQIERRLQAGNPMTEDEVNQVLGGKGVEQAEELGKAVGGLLAKVAKGMPGAEDADKLGELFGQLGAMTGRRVVRWGNQNRYVICILVNGKVTQVEQRGL